MHNNYVIILLSNADNSDKNLYILSLFDKEQTNHFKIGKFCLLMMSKLNVKWPVTQTGGQKRLQLLLLLVLATLLKNFNS